jgi:predicted acetyltransferase
MPNLFHFNETITAEQLVDLKNKYLQSLSRPPDGMWESFRDQARPIELMIDGQSIGYAGLGAENELLQFYILPEYMAQGPDLFQAFIQQFNVKAAMVGTHHPTFLSLALHFVKALEVHTYLFTNTFDVPISERSATLQVCLQEDLERMVEFYHYSMDAPKTWLKGYLGALIEQGAVFILGNEEGIIGACEVRVSKNAPEVVDLGMVISPDYRRKGYGTYLLNKAKSIALKWQKIPICSCEKENIGSQKAIQNCGFVSTHHLLLIDL